MKSVMGLGRAIPVRDLMSLRPRASIMWARPVGLKRGKKKKKKQKSYSLLEGIKRKGSAYLD